jgi:hypothetical protein
MGYPAYVVRIHSLGGGASLAAAALGYAEGKVAAGGHSFLWRAGYRPIPVMCAAHCPGHCWCHVANSSAMLLPLHSEGSDELDSHLAAAPGGIQRCSRHIVGCCALPATSAALPAGRRPARPRTVTTHAAPVHSIHLSAH